MPSETCFASEPFVFNMPAINCVALLCSAIPLSPYGAVATCMQDRPLYSNFYTARAVCSDLHYIYIATNITLLFYSVPVH